MSGFGFGYVNDRTSGAGLFQRNEDKSIKYVFEII